MLWLLGIEHSIVAVVRLVVGAGAGAMRQKNGSRQRSVGAKKKPYKGLIKFLTGCSKSDFKKLLNTLLNKGFCRVASAVEWLKTISLVEATLNGSIFYVAE